MTDETRKDEKIEIKRADEDAPKSAWQDPPVGADAEADAATESDPITALELEKAELKNQLLRSLADMENLRRRTQKQVRDASQYGIANFARDLLTVGDNLRRAIETVSEEVRASADSHLKTLLDGVEMTERELLRALDKHGVKKSDPQGERFDPNFHQAMFEVSDKDVASGTVVQVVQPGYVIGDRVLRPAMVGVAKGGPKPAPAPAEPDAGEAEAEPSAGGAVETDATEPGAQMDKRA